MELARTVGKESLMDRTVADGRERQWKIGSLGGD
jgi:hypothetical protein